MLERQDNNPKAAPKNALIPGTKNKPKSTYYALKSLLFAILAAEQQNRAPLAFLLGLDLDLLVEVV